MVERAKGVRIGEVLVMVRCEREESRLLRERGRDPPVTVQAHL